MIYLSRIIIYIFKCIDPKSVIMHNHLIRGFSDITFRNLLHTYINKLSADVLRTKEGLFVLFPYKYLVCITTVWRIIKMYNFVTTRSFCTMLKLYKYSIDRKQSKKILRALDTCSYVSVCIYVCVRIFRVKYFSYISMLSNFTSAIKISEFFLLKFSLYLFHKQIVGSVKKSSVWIKYFIRDLYFCVYFLYFYLCVDLKYVAK